MGGGGGAADVVVDATIGGGGDGVSWVTETSAAVTDCTGGMGVVESSRLRATRSILCVDICFATVSAPRTSNEELTMMVSVSNLLDDGRICRLLT